MITQERFAGRRWLALLGLVLAPGADQAKNIGADPPNPLTACASCVCRTCGVKPPIIQPSDTSSVLSRTEGNLAEQAPVSITQSSTASTIVLNAVYNSYNADDSRAALDTVMGYGWTHTYNDFLFSQFGAMFRYDGTGRVTKFGLGAGGAFVTAAGYFETLSKTSGTTYTLTEKDRTVYTYASIAGTPFLVGGPVWRLTRIVDRNGNTTTLTYSGGNLTLVTDTYNRSTAFTYTAQKKVAAVMDPAGRVTQFTYDTTGHKLTKITDPNGNSIQYGYNALYQLTAKTDKAGRVFTYTYSNGEAVSVNDNAGSSPGTLSNPGNWATSASALAANETRTYIPATTTVIDGRGNAWQYQYDSNGYPIKTTAPDGSVTSYAYDPATLLMSSMTDANGNTTRYTYNSQGDLTQVKDALGNVTAYTYEPVFNMVASMTDPRGRTTTYTIDPATGNKVQETDPLGNTAAWTYDAHGNLITATDKNGNRTKYQFDSSGDLIQTTDPLGNTTIYSYDAVGNRTSTTDANGNTTQYKYDGMNRIVQETDALNHSSATVYDGEGNRIQSTDRNGNTTQFQYDLRQRPITTIDALGNAETYAWDANDNRISLTDRDGHTTAYGYDSQNRPNKIIDALGNTSATAYDGAGNAIAATDANGHTVINAYDALNRRVKTTDAVSETTLYQYDTGTFSGCGSCGAVPGSDAITGRTDANGKVTYYKYDALNRQIETVRKVGSAADTIAPSDAVTVYTFDAVDNRLTLTEPDGNTTVWTYDADNRIAKTVNQAGDTTLTAYDPVGNVISETEPNLDAIAMAYDALNRRIASSDSAGTIGMNTYDNEGNRLTITDGIGNTTQYGYDAINRLIATVDPLGKTATTAYDAVGNLLMTTDRNGNVTTYSYDTVNRRVMATDALGNATQSQYDHVGNLIQLTDAESHATQYALDAVNRLAAETYPDGTHAGFAYDGVGNLLRRTDQNGSVTQYTYNDLYFLVSRTYPSALNDSFTYDLSGRMLTAQRGSWPETFSYDGADRLLQSVQNGQTVSYIYDIPGRTRTVTYPGGRAITETTDARRRIAQIDDASAPPPIARYSYDAADNVLGRNYRNGTSAAYTYNANNWATNVQHSNASTFAGFSYAYDNEGDKEYENKQSDTTHSEAYRYDAAYRLTGYAVGALAGSTVPVPSTQTSYNLDPVGNWSSKTTNAVTQTRSHNVTNELIEIGSTVLAYDANGNALSDGSYSYMYDEENRLTRITRSSDSAAVAQYTYDALGRRVEKIADPAGSPVTTLYYWDDQRIVEEQDAASTTQATYVYGNSVDETLAMDRGGQSYYYHQNATGSVEAITNGGGVPVERYSYDAYGAVTITDGEFSPVSPNAWGTPHSAIGNPYTFTGRQLDEEAGLFYYRARFYNAAEGRFLQRDPIEYGDGMNLYQYVGSRPTRFTDPFGLLTLEKCIESVKKLLDGKVDYEPKKVVNGDTSFKINGWKKEVEPTNDLEKLLKYVIETKDKETFNACLLFIDCVQCKGNSDVHGRFVRGTTIELIAAQGGGWDSKDMTPTHELVHAADNCAKLFPGKDCENRLKREVRAYKFANKCSGARQCVAQATNSCKDNGCTQEQITAILQNDGKVNELYKDAIDKKIPGLDAKP